MNAYEKGCAIIADDYCKRFAKAEERIAREMFGCSYSELDEDERAEVAFEAHDELDG